MPQKDGQLQWLAAATCLTTGGATDGQSGSISGGTCVQVYTKCGQSSCLYRQLLNQVSVLAAVL